MLVLHISRVAVELFSMLLVGPCKTLLNICISLFKAYSEILITDSDILKSFEYLVF